ncbi:hypothetical protein HYS10_00505, partial [Candidatus Collierbacteria bacterium]|nr:hypothetical protein [Candidatus Collierbacteria bacterium]
MEKPNLSNENAHQELYSLLWEAEHKFSSAITATASIRPRPEGVSASQTIFKTTLGALVQYKWVGNLPIIDEYPHAPTDTAILPPPILVALAYCLDNTQTVCLKLLGLTSGQTIFDNAILSWPTTLLRDLPAKSRLFYDMSHILSS